MYCCGDAVVRSAAECALHQNEVFCFWLVLTWMKDFIVDAFLRASDILLSSRVVTKQGSVPGGVYRSL